MALVAVERPGVRGRRVAGAKLVARRLAEQARAEVDGVRDGSRGEAVLEARLDAGHLEEPILHRVVPSEIDGRVGDGGIADDAVVGGAGLRDAIEGLATPAARVGIG